MVRRWQLIQADARRIPLANDSVHCVVTSPPYWLQRDYGISGQLGNEPTPQEYVANQVQVFEEVRRVLRPDGVLWLNIGDKASPTGKHGGRSGGKNSHSANGSMPQRKCLVNLKVKDTTGIPWMLAFALRDAGWYLRSECIWHKPNAMTESVTDRPSKCHEQVFLLSKSPKYFYDFFAVREASTGPGRFGTHKARKGIDTKGGNQGNGVPLTWDGDGRNLRSVWKIATRSFKGAHFATFPIDLATRCILAGTSEHGCCRTCGAPFERKLNRVRIATRTGEKTKLSRNRATGDYVPLNGKPWAAAEVGNRDPLRHITKFEHVGWKAGCKCGGDPVPCTVFDPFSGAATTVLAALCLGRRVIGTELNPEYNELARKRIEVGVQRKAFC